MPEVSVILPAYNGEKFIKETLESLLAQTFSDLEVVVVDDGSTDTTAEIVKSFMDSRLRGNDGAGGDSRIRYFHKGNSGNQAIPRNFGIKKAQGKYIAFCDQDDIWYPDKLERQMKVIGGKDLGLVVTSADIIDEKGKKTGVRYVPEGHMDSAESFSLLLEEDFITACSVLIPKQVLDDIGGLEESLKGNDDYELWLRISRKYGIYGIGEALCAWRRSEGAYSKEMSRIFEENKKIFSKIEPENDDERVHIERGRKLNISRLFVAYLKEGDYKKAGTAMDQLDGFSGTAKVALVSKLFRLSPSLAGLVARSTSRVKEGT